MNLETYRGIATSTIPADESGAELLGSGCFGSAYKLRDGTVLKCGYTVDGTALWIGHAAKVFRDTGKPAQYAPRVYGFEITEGGRWWARMEWVIPALESAGSYDAGACSNAMRSYLRRWGYAKGIVEHVGEYRYPDAHAGNWGHTRDGREVCFDPFAGEQPYEKLELVLRASRPLPKNRSVTHAGPSRGRWARG